MPNHHVPEKGFGILRWTITVLVAAAVGIVTVRVIGCIQDSACTFAPGALQTAVLAFVGGPLMIAAVWIGPALARRVSLPAWIPPVLIGVGVVGALAGFFTMRGGDPVGAVIPALGAGLVVAGVFAGADRRER